MDIGLAELSIGMVANNALTATVTWYLSRRQYRATAAVTEADSRVRSAEGEKAYINVYQSVIDDLNNRMAQMLDENASIREERRIDRELIEQLQEGRRQDALKIQMLERKIEEIKVKFPCDNCPNR
jgi:hypothetical protein